MKKHTDQDQLNLTGEGAEVEQFEEAYAERNEQAEAEAARFDEENQDPTWVGPIQHEGMDGGTYTVTHEDALDRFGRAFADACMKATVDAALRKGWTGERMMAESERFSAVIREEAVAEVKWVTEQGRAVLEMVDAGSMGPGYLDVTFQAAVGAVAARSMRRMEA